MGFTGNKVNQIFFSHREILLQIVSIVKAI